MPAGRVTRPGLSQYDRSPDATWQARQARHLGERAGYLKVISGAGCWCGATLGHDWTGKPEGDPHPRDWPGRVNGHPYRCAEEKDRDGNNEHRKR